MEGQFSTRADIKHKMLSDKSSSNSERNSCQNRRNGLRAEVNLKKEQYIEAIPPDL
jgi:hypothetical protein